MLARVWLLIALLCPAVLINADALVVKVDPRVELLSIVFRLAGNPEYNMGNSKSRYSDDVEAHFGSFRDHATVQMARKLRSTRGISYDAVMSMAVHLADEPWKPRPRTPLDPRPPLLEGRWTATDAQAFIDALDVFCKDTDFKGFVDDHADLYAKSGTALAAVVNQHDYVNWFNRFFGERPKATFVVIVGMLNGGGNYGVSMRHRGGKEEITPVIGIYKWSDDGLPAVGDEIVPTIVHEFCHAYTNALVDAHYTEIQSAGAELFNANKSTMARQAYGNGKTVLYETMVRACVAYYMKTEQGAGAGEKQVRYEASRGFDWVGGLVALLAEYDADRATFASFDAFMPRVSTYLKQAAKEQQAVQKRAPQVVSISPENGTKAVDAGKITAVVIKFDRPMRDKSWSIVGGGESFPAFDKPRYDATRKILTVPVKLEAGKSYRFGLNSESFHAFAAEDGTPLAPVIVTFSTKP